MDASIGSFSESFSVPESVSFTPPIVSSDKGTLDEAQLTMEYFKHVGDTIIVENNNKRVLKGDDGRGERRCYGNVCIDANKLLKHLCIFHHINGSYRPKIGIAEAVINKEKRTTSYLYDGAYAVAHIRYPSYNIKHDFGAAECSYGGGSIVCMLLNDFTLSFCVLSLDSYCTIISNEYKTKNIDTYPWKVAAKTIRSDVMYRMCVSVYDLCIELLDYQCSEADLFDEEKEHPQSLAEATKTNEKLRNENERLKRIKKEALMQVDSLKGVHMKAMERIDKLTRENCAL
eukprot:80502_1